MLISIPDMLIRIGDCPGKELLTLAELDFMSFNMTRNRGYAFGVLPYATPEERALADSIAKKLKLNKFFRGPRGYGRYSNATRTLKENATKVALYLRP
jgi:hypothetical protein